MPANAPVVAASAPSTIALTGPDNARPARVALPRSPAYAHVNVNAASIIGDSAGIAVVAIARTHAPRPRRVVLVVVVVVVVVLVVVVLVILNGIIKDV